MLIETKLRPPELRKGLIERTALLDQLDQALNTRLAIVSAPAGFGKSTLLGQWALRQKERGLALGWLSLDAADDDLGRFLDYFAAALHRADTAIGPGIPALLRSSPVLPVDSILTTLINDLSFRSQDLLLVLDDCHFLTTVEIVRFLDAFLTYAPPAFHLLLTSRGPVPLKVGNMRVRGQMIRLDDMNLRFSLTETETFLNEVHGLGLDRHDVVSLQHRTEGWIAGLQLASLSLEDRADRAVFIQRFSGTDRDVADFLVNDVLARLPEETIDFLLKTSILDRINAPLAEAVTGLAHAGNLLAGIEAANLFLMPLDRERRWYRYHHLFAGLLRSLLAKQHAAQIPGLHRAAAQWLSDNELVSDAVQHALAAGDTAFAAGLVEACCMPLIQQGQIIRVSEWLNSLPEDLVKQRPRLQLANVWILFHMSHALPAASILKSARSSIQQAERQGLLTALERQDLRAELYTLTAGVISAADRSATAARLAKRWLTQFPEGRHFAKGTLGNVLGFCLFSLGDLEGSRLACMRARESHEQVNSVLGVAYSNIILGFDEQAAGNLRLANECFERAIRHARAELGPGSYAEAMAGISQVELLYEWNDLAGADRLLQQHRQLIEECGLVIHEMTCKLYVAKLAVSRGQHDEALSLFERAERQGLRTRYRRLFASALHERVRLLLQRGDAQSARLVLKGRGIDETWIASRSAQRTACEPEHMAVARLLIAEQRPEAAIRILDRLAERLRRDGRLQRLAQVRAIAAIAAHQAGDALSALAAIVDAISLSAPHGALRGLMDEGPALQDVLAFARNRIPSWKTSTEVSTFIDQLLDGRQRSSASDTAVNLPRGLPQFSAREADVARLLTSGQSNREVAKPWRWRRIR